MTMSFRPSALCTVACTGQTGSQGAFSPYMQGTGWKYGPSGFSGSPEMSINAINAFRGCD
jgi:hypothetical protein